MPAHTRTRSIVLDPSSSLRLISGPALGLSLVPEDPPAACVRVPCARCARRGDAGNADRYGARDASAKRSRRTARGLVFVAAHRPRLGASIGARRSI